MSNLDTLGPDVNNPKVLQDVIRILEAELATRPPAARVVRAMMHPPIEAEGRWVEDECVPG